MSRRAPLRLAAITVSTCSSGMARSKSTSGRWASMTVCRLAGSTDDAGATSRPSTRFASCTPMALASVSGSSSEFERIRSNPAAFATSAAPLVAWAKNGFSMSPTTMPSVFDRPVLIVLASALGR